MGEGGQGGEHHDQLRLPEFACNRNAVSFSHALPDFRAGRDTPRAFLERCLERIVAREAELRAFAALNIDGARAAADAAGARYRAGQPLSMVDGCLVGIKDIMDTRDMPTRMGSPVYAGWQPRYDAACVQALRFGGAVIVGKTVTTAFACGATNSTVNPHDSQRTPGGSSSGSAAAVGAGMLPVALGTQTQGSTLRPASFCGAVGFKPTHGALTMQGVHPISVTHDHLGVIGGTLEDTWRIASHISLANGNPGQAFLDGASAELPAPAKPRRLLRLYTRHWEQEVDPAARDAFEAVLEKLQRAGVVLAGRGDDSDAAALEQALDDGFVERSLDITAYEMKWPYAQYIADHGQLMEKRVHDRIARAQTMLPAEYEALLSEKAAMKTKVRDLMRAADGIITLAASGPAPVGHAHTGSRAFLTYATFLGLPAFSLPLMSVGGLPVGLQLIGHAGGDGKLCALARWIMREIAAQ
ncbi:MAG: amidase [Betaproteobacteria bacterium]|nr:amidase [Betaproteobacteria bacterium]